MDIKAFAFLFSLIFSIVIIQPAFADEDTIISIIIIGESEFYLDSDNKLFRAKVVIENFDPAGDGYYFMRVSDSSGNVVKETEILPKYKGNQIWGTEIAHIITNEVPETFQILIYTEFGTATATATISLLETKPPSSAFAQIETISEYGSVRIDNESYEIKSGETFTIKVSGNVIDVVGGGKLTIIIIDPEGLSEGLQSSVTDSGDFVTYWTVDDESLIGEYEVAASYFNHQIGSVYFTLKEKEFSEEELLEARGMGTEESIELESIELEPPQQESPADTEETVQKDLEVSESAGILRIDKRIHEVTFRSSDKIKISGQVNTWSWSRSGSATVTLTITSPNGQPEKITTYADKEKGGGNFETSFPINYYSQRGIYKITGFYENRCPPMQLCQRVNPVNFGTLSFVVRGEILDDYPLQVQEYGLYEQGLEKLAEREYDEALQLFKSSLKEDPENTETQNAISNTEAKILEKKQACSGSSIPNSINWMDSRRECCRYLPVDEASDCSQAAGFTQQQYWKQVGYDPWEARMHEENERLEQKSIEAARKQNEEMQQKLNDIAPYAGIGIAAAVGGGIALSLRNKNKRRGGSSPLVYDRENKPKKSPEDEMKWEGI